MLRHGVLAVIAVSTFLTGCDRFGSPYEIVSAGDRTFVINKTTGHTRLIEGSSFTEVTSLEKTQNPPHPAKIWPVQDMPQLDNIKLTIRTKFRDGSLLYSVEASPFGGRLEREFAARRSSYSPGARIYVDFFDADGFSIGAPLQLQIGEATRIVDNQSKPISLSWTGSQSMSRETYEAAAYQNIRWSGFSE